MDELGQLPSTLEEDADALRRKVAELEVQRAGLEGCVDDYKQRWLTVQQEVEELRQQLSRVVPSYFEGGITPKLVLYTHQGYNHQQAEDMLNLCVPKFCKQGAGCCNLYAPKPATFPQFRLEDILRLENKNLFAVFQAKEIAVAEEVREASEADFSLPTEPVPSWSEWLLRLEEKNGLSKLANTRYMLHGTRNENLASITKDGLTAKFSQPSGCLYGNGIYLTNSSCKARQYSDGTILVCRVILGRIFVLDKDDVERKFAPQGFHSCMAKARRTKKQGVTRKGKPARQLHDELIVYHDAQVYPEFVLHYTQEGVTLLP